MSEIPKIESMPREEIYILVIKLIDNKDSLINRSKVVQVRQSKGLK